MIKKIEDGGPAFPRIEQDAGGTTRIYVGMSRRDWFAGQALVEFASFVTVGVPETFDIVARHCYRMADAMLAASKAGEA